MERITTEIIQTKKWKNGRDYGWNCCRNLSENKKEKKSQYGRNHYKKNQNQSKLFITIEVVWL